MNEPLPPPFGDLTCQSLLFDLPEAGERPTPAPEGGTPRLRRAERHQVVFRPLALDALLPPEHEARAVWAYVEGLDLDGFIKHIRAVEGRAGRDATLQEHLREAQAQVQALKAELEADPSTAHDRQQQARCRAAAEQQQRVAQALAHLPEVAAKKKPADRAEARASTTDAEAHFMKMADGGCRPAYNVQYATATDSQVIVGVDVHTTGSDLGQLLPMVEQIQDRYGETPQEMLADGNFAKHDDITTLAEPEYGTTVYSPVKGPNNKANDRYTPKPTDSPAVAAWRQRMVTAAAQVIYKLRAATAECVNALARNRGLQQFLVRGRLKVKCIALWFAVAHNLRRALTLRAGTLQGTVNPL